MPTPNAAPPTDPASAPALPTQPPATQADIETLADSLTACADALHARLLRAMRTKPPAPGDKPPAEPVHGLPREQAQALFDTEVALRQRANALHLDAALLAAAGLAGHQLQLLDLAARARQAVGRIDHWRDIIDIAGQLLTLAAAVAAGKPEHIAAPLEQIKHGLDALQRG